MPVSVLWAKGRSSWNTVGATSPRVGGVPFQGSGDRMSPKCARSAAMVVAVAKCHSRIGCVSKESASLVCRQALAVEAASPM